jgi:hypothetical protein
MNKPPPDEGQLEHWLKTTRYEIENAEQLRHEGFYEKKRISIQAHYADIADEYADLGRSRCLNGEPIDIVRKEFSRSADYMIKVFRMAYDPEEPEFVEEKENIAWHEIEETSAIDGMNWALMSGSRDKAKEMARWWRNRPEKKTKHEVTNRYTFALQHAILGGREQAEELMDISMLYYAGHPPKGHNFQHNYYTLSLTVQGIVTKDKKKFNEGLALQLKFYEGEALSEENYNVPEGYIDDDAVALANLGIFYGLKVTTTHMLLPPGLLIQAA